MKPLHPAQAACTVLVLGLGAVTWYAFSSMSNQRPANPPPVLPAMEAEAAANQAAGQPYAKSWPAPKAQARGPDWVFELFSPPEIEYNAGTRTHRVKPSAGGRSAIAVAIAAPASVPVLLDVRHEDYPLQLTGFVGEGAQALGLFENRVSGETLLLRSGGRVEALGIEIVDFQVQRAAVAIPESMSVHEPRATATLRGPDGGTLLLQQGVTAPGPGLIARIAIGGETAELPEGGALTQGPVVYRIAKIRLAPAAVDLIKEHTGDGSTEKLVLNATPLSDPNQP